MNLTLRGAIRHAGTDFFLGTICVAQEGGDSEELVFTFEIQGVKHDPFYLEIYRNLWQKTYAKRDQWLKGNISFANESITLEIILIGFVLRLVNTYKKSSDGREIEGIEITSYPLHIDHAAKHRVAKEMQTLYQESG